MSKGVTEDKHNNSFLIGFLMGGGIAAITTFLLTWSKEEQNKKIIQKTAEALPEMAGDFLSTMQENASRIQQQAKTKWQKTMTRLQVAVAAAIQASKNAENPQQPPNSHE
ncbi:MAG: YtxH domain-containing protein [Geminocystis sp.]|nr:YtxH domain-containing protein [Geminocystis sp.]HIK37262.1 YtxH domain-containing protein [Geminocystis sp. M7585_C2015_104]MCS7148219.1 YtxH domain-containing protein [Geminocystis sp.]MCX8077633.1 YtxH domain-containing protein [Geminocystis sp.]MDW8116525.1 YtxH domain-containing protein [Geminocystis sp.]